MAIEFRSISKAEALSRVVKGNGVKAENPFVDLLGELTAEDAVEVGLDEGETMKKVKTQITQASKATGVRVTCGETDDGKLIVALAAADERAVGEKGPKARKNDAA